MDHCLKRSQFWCVSFGLSMLKLSKPKRNKSVIIKHFHSPNSCQSYAQNNFRSFNFISNAFKKSFDSCADLWHYPETDTGRRKKMQRPKSFTVWNVDPRKIVSGFKSIQKGPWTSFLQSEVTWNKVTQCWDSYLNRIKIYSLSPSLPSSNNIINRLKTSKYAKLNDTLSIIYLPKYVLMLYV